jgi:hypothetical protein
MIYKYLLMKLTNFGILAILVLINIIYVFWERW